ncbi:MAG: hypothetical protein PHP23_02635 [Desulfobacterales bacterium]|nr:hypothetical protein [Desulfobacterales bacterium]MDD4072439.1 hypothetical protein [Desulfobacterales bacterium]MDD4392731.1 hypothetical protein [Desulfobacterales bacterium]
MNILVCIKQVPDPVSIEVDRHTGRIDKKRIVYVTNPSDINALETALRIREKIGGSVTTVCVGPDKMERSLRQCKALGADDAYRIWADDWPLNEIPVAVAFAVARFVRENNFNLLLFGDTGDMYHADPTPAWVAEFLGMPMVSAATEVLLSDQMDSILIKRKQEKGFRQAIECQLPAVVTVDASINKPREASLPGKIDAEIFLIKTVEMPLTSLLHMYQKPDVMIGLKYQMLPFKPEPHLIFTPDPDLTAEQRIDAFVSGGMEAKKGLVVNGEPGEVAEGIISFMQENRLIEWLC